MISRIGAVRRKLSEEYCKLSYTAAGYRPISKRQFIAELAHAIEKRRGYATGKIGRTAQYMVKYEMLCQQNAPAAMIRELEYGLEFQCLKQQGIFPVDNSFYRRYSRFYIEQIRNLDCLGICYYPGELEILKYYQLTNKLIHYTDQEPDRSVPDNQGSCYLQFFGDKKILIICPFAEALKNRATQEVFEGVWWKTGKKWFRPASVEALEFPYGFAYETHKQYATVLDLLEEVKTRIHQRDFDIALIGAAGLAIPLASFIKDLGKVAVDLGGHLQFLFGVLGKRWRTTDLQAKYFTRYWIDMPASYKPNETDVCDDGAYW
jgi:hypothetical protein